MMMASSSRKERFVDVDGSCTQIMMEDAYRSMPRSYLQFMYNLDKTEEECKEILKKERSKNQDLDKALDKALSIAHKRRLDADVFTLAKIAYTLQTPNIYGEFNSGTREMKTFFEWETFNFKGLWIILYKSLLHDSGEDNLHNTVQVFRGVGRSMTAKPGSIVTFQQFTSTSTDRAIAESFLKEKPSESTLFAVTVSNGLKLKKYSQFPNEEEILLRPSDGLRVKNVQKTRNGLTIISLEQELSLRF